MQFKRAIRESCPVIVGLSGPSGSGKTMSGILIGLGLAGGKTIALIDTENGRAKHYADQFAFDVADLRAPFSPKAYTEAILEADKAGYPVIVVDSVSHVWAGEGGCLDWHEQELNRMAGDNYGKRAACAMAAWLKPKAAHKAMVQALLQVKAHVVLCFRAEPKIEMVKDAQGKMQVVEKKGPTSLNGWTPICEKGLPYELTLSFLFMADKPGVPMPIKLQEQHKPFFPSGQLVTEESGKRLAEWAAGGKEKANVEQPTENGAGSMMPSWFNSYQKGFKACTSIDQLKLLGNDVRQEGREHLSPDEKKLLWKEYKNREQELELAGSCEPV